MASSEQKPKFSAIAKQSPAYQKTNPMSNTISIQSTLADTGILESPAFLKMKAAIDWNDKDSVKELFGYIADALSAFAKFTPNKIDDQLAVMFQYGVNSDLVWTAFWKFFINNPDAKLESITPETCRDYESVAYASADTTEAYAGAGFLSLVSLVQFVRLAIQVYREINS